MSLRNTRYVSKYQTRSTSSCKQALVEAGPHFELRWHYQHGRQYPHESAGRNNKHSRIHKHGKIRRVRPFWKE